MKTGPIDCPQELLPALISYLKRLSRKGITSLYLDSQSAAPAPNAAKGNEDMTVPKNQAARSAAAPPSSPEPAAPANESDALTELAALEKKVLTCTDCALHEGRTNGVFGTGSHTTRVMFIGEGPGAEEDKQGKPFVGRSGQLLTKMIEAIDLTRDEAYIANIVKCRPPNNRDPLEDEVRCCEKYLIEQIRLIRPRVICALGRVSAHWLLQTDEALGVMRNAEHHYQNTPVLVTYHPAALLRNPNLKRNAWEDFKKLRGMIAD